MFLIRRAKVDDVATILKLARMVHFINLPPDRDILTDKVTRSRRSFFHAANPDAAGGPAGEGEILTEGRLNGEAPGGAGPGESAGLAETISRGDLFMFVLEDLDSGGVLGTSQVIARMGGPGHPNLSLQLRKREFFSQALKQGGTHITAQLVLDETGPTEIGGLILQPSLRGHPMKLGRFLSLVRFHFIGLHRRLFSERMLAEMMGPVTADSHSTFWEYLGRRFINLTYDEADRFCQHSKEFMISLLPREEIYLTLLPPEARTVVGQVGPETMPARRMLERLGFRYLDRIDPFDGGPNLEAMTDEIPLVRLTRRAEAGEPCGGEGDGDCTEFGIVSVLDPDGEFRAVQTEYAEDRAGRVRLPKVAARLLGVESGMELGVTPLSRGSAAGAETDASAGSGAKRKARGSNRSATTKKSNGRAKSSPRTRASKGG